MDSYIESMKESWVGQAFILMTVLVGIALGHWLVVPIGLYASLCMGVIVAMENRIDNLIHAYKSLNKGHTELCIQVIHLGTLNRQLRQRLGEEP